MEATVEAPSGGTETTIGSAPATAEPSSASTPESRPTSMRAAFERIEQKQAKSPDAGKPGTATTVQPAPGEKPAVAAPQGPIPLEVHTKAIENARTKGAAEALAKHRETYGWAEKIQPQQLQQWGSIANRIATDRVGFGTDFLTELQQKDPAGFQAVMSKFGGNAQPANGNGAAAPRAVEPDVEIRDDQGRVVGKAYSADANRALVQQLLTEAIGKEVGPLKTDHERRQADQQRQNFERLQTETTERNHKAADAILSDVYGILDLGADHSKFTAAEKALVDEVDAKMASNPGMSAHAAALAVRKEKVVPRIEGQATEKAITEMQRKAAGNTANGAGRTATPKRPTNPRELAQWMRARDTSASA